MTDKATDAPEAEAKEKDGNTDKVVGKIARALYSGTTEGKFDKEAYEPVKKDYHKQARSLLRRLEKQGLKLTPTD